MGERVRVRGKVICFPFQVIIITRSRKCVPPGLYTLIENPPKSPFSKGGLSEVFHKIPPFDKGGIGGISIRGQVRKVIYKCSD
jgi:hypothetical protein